MPYSIGLQREQLEDLDRRSKAGNCPKASFIYYAIKRWRRGDFTIPEQNPGEKDIVPLVIWKKIDLPDWQVRCILRKHFEVPDQQVIKEFEKWDRISRELMEFYTGKEIIFENPEEESRYERQKNSNVGKEL